MVDVGYTSGPGDYSDSSYASTLVATKFTAGASGTLQSLSLYMLATGGGNVTIGIYSHDAANNRPGTLLATTASTASSVTNAYQTINTTTNPTIASGTVYWFVFEHSTTASNIVSYDLSVSGARYGYYAQTYGDLPSTWPGALSGAYDELAFQVYGTLSTQDPNTGVAAFSPIIGSGTGSVGTSPFPVWAETSAVASGTTTVTLNMPSVRASGRILLAILESANQTISVSDGGGLTWTEVYAQQGTGTAGGTSATLLAVYWARDNGTATAPVFACASGNHCCGVIASFVDCVAEGDPINVSIGGVKSTSSTTTSITGATTTEDNCLVVAVVSRMDDNVGPRWSDWTNASLTSILEVTDTGTTTGNGGGFGACAGRMASQGTYNSTTATNGTTTVNGFISFALLPKTTSGNTGTGTGAFSTMAASGTGGVDISGSGSAAFAPFDASGTGGHGNYGTGSAALSSFAASGTGTVTEPPQGKISVDLGRNAIAASATTYYGVYSPLHFKDSITGDLVWILDNANNALYIWTQTARDVAPTLVATVSGGLSGPFGADQDSNGVIQVCGEYGGGFNYSRITLTRSGGHITGASSSTPFSLPSMTSSLGGSPWGCSVIILNDRVVIARLDGNDNNQYCAALIHGPLDATTATQFTSLAGTASTWTKCPTQTASANVNVPYCFNVTLEQYNEDGSFFVVAGAASRGDVGDYSCSLVGFRCEVSGANWVVDTVDPCTLATETDETLLGCSCRDSYGNAYILWTQRTGSAAVTVGLSKVATDGTFTASWISTTTAYGGEIKGFPAVFSDGTVVLGLIPGDTGSSGTRPEIKVYSNSVWYTYQAMSTRHSVLAWTEKGSRGWTDGFVWSLGDSAYPVQRSIGAVQIRVSSSGNVYYDNYEWPAYSDVSGTTITPSYAPAVPHLTKDMHVFVAAMKPSTANSGTITWPSGFTEQEAFIGGGYGETLGDDTGNTRISIATKDSVNGSESGTISVGLATNNIAWAMALRVSKGGDGNWNYASTSGTDDTGGATYTVTYSDAISLAPGDLVVIAASWPTDVTTDVTGQTITASGITFGEVTVVAVPNSGTGTDIGGWVGFCRVVSGSGTVAPTFTATVGGTTTNIRGPSVLLRLRELVGPPVPIRALNIRNYVLLRM